MKSEGVELYLIVIRFGFYCYSEDDILKIDIDIGNISLLYWLSKST